MTALALWTLLSAIGCWAPDPDAHPNLSDAGPPPTRIPAPDEALAAPLALDGQPALGWTRAAPLTLVRAGGSPAVTLDRYGVRVDILQRQAHRVRVRCTGCAPEQRDEDLWLQAGQLSTGPAAGDDPLSAALRLRARWASGEAAPVAGLSADALCALIDAGFAWNTDEARFAWGGGSLLLQFAGGAWQLGTFEAPSEPPTVGCDPKGPAAGASGPASG